jgi:hypothetical protein
MIACRINQQGVRESFGDILPRDKLEVSTAVFQLFLVGNGELWLIGPILHHQQTGWIVGTERHIDNIGPIGFVGLVNGVVITDDEAAQVGIITRTFKDSILKATIGLNVLQFGRKI